MCFFVFWNISSRLNGLRKKIGRSFSRGGARPARKKKETYQWSGGGESIHIIALRQRNGE